MNYQTSGSDVAPQSIKTAQLFMYLGALLSLAGIIYALVSRDDIRREVLRQDPDIGNLNTIVNVAVATTVIVSILAAALWIWMAMANGKGKSWARIVATVLFALNAIGLITTFTGASNSTTLQKVINGLTFLAGLAAIWFLYRKDASDFFRRMSAVTTNPSQAGR